MGCFSWINSDTGYNILGGEKINLLCPNGTVLSDNHYDGYGNVAGHDVYFLLAMWNRKAVLDYLVKDSIRRTFGKEEHYAMYFDRKVSDEELYEIEDEIADSIREVGIFLQFLESSDLRDKVMKYPLKFVEDTKLKYNGVSESLDDPEQGFSRYHVEYGRYLGTCANCGDDMWENECDSEESIDGLCCCSACADELNSYYHEDDNDYNEDEE